MNKNKINKIFADTELNIVVFYSQMKGILNSKRGRKFQYMMLGRTFEAIIRRNSQLREKYGGPEKPFKNPLDSLFP